MAYGKIKADAIVYDNNGTDAEGALSSLVNAANAVSLKADIASPALTGTPTAPTASAGTNTTQIATTAYADNAASVAAAGVVSSAPGTLDTLNELAAALGDDANFSTTVTNSIATKLPLAGGTLTGDLTLSGAPTSNLHAATKAYVDSNAGIGASGGTFTGNVSFNEAISIERVKEKTTIDSASVPSTVNFDVNTQAVLYQTGSVGGDWTYNLRGDSSTTLNSLMSVGETLTVVGIIAFGSNVHKLGGVQVDGTSANVTVRYVGGAPTSNVTANAIVTTTISVIKTANTTFTVLVSQAEYEA